MAESKGPPRKTTTYNRFSTMASQNQRYNTKQDEFYWLENIMRVAPHKLHSVPGPILRDTFPKVNPCVDSTERGQAVVTIDTAFDLTDPDGSLRTSWAYANNGELYALVGVNTCAGGNMVYQTSDPYPSFNCVQIYHYLDGNPTIHDVFGVPIPDPTAPFANTRVGVSDVPVWAANSNAFNGLRIYFDLGLTFVDYVTPSNNGGGHGVDAFAIAENEVWLWIPNRIDSGPPFTAICKFDKATGTLIDTYHPFQDLGAPDGNGTISNLQLTSNYLYALGTPQDGPVQIIKINRSDGTIAATFKLDDINPQFIGVANDDLIYILKNGTPAGIYYLVNFTDLIYVGKTPGKSITPFGLGSGIWDGGSFYFGSNGFAGFNIDINKITVSCPPVTGKVIASISTGATVAAGATINVTWTDILLPDSTDQIDLRPAPTGGSLGFVGASLAHLSTGSAAGGTLPFTIPGGTTPGNYIFELTTESGGILIATSNTFAVT